MSLTFNFLLEISRTVKPIASDTLYNHLFKMKNDKFQFLLIRIKCHCTFRFRAYTSAILPRLAICICPTVLLLSRGSNAKSQFPAARTPNDSRWRFTVRMCVSWWKLFSRCARENSASRVTYQPQSDMIPRALGMWYIIYRMPQILFLLMADAWGWCKKDEK